QPHEGPRQIRRDPRRSDEGGWRLGGARPLPSRVYTLFAQAIRERRPVTCRYGGKTRELCPIILGHTDGKEKALTFQFAGESRSRLPEGGEWRCLFLDKVSDVEWARGLGTPATVTVNRKPASRRWTSTSIRRAL